LLFALVLGVLPRFPLGRARCTWRRCYKLASLLHTNRAGEFFLCGGLRVSAGRDHENPLLYELVEAFVHYPGRGVMKRLILDRAFLDGPCIGRCKKELGIEVLILARTNLDIYQDVVGLAEAGLLSFQDVPTPEPPPPPVPLQRPERIRKREAARQRKLAQRKQAAAQNPKAPAPLPAQPLRHEVAAVADLQTFTTCPVPLQAVVNRDLYSDGQHEYWVRLDTAPLADALQTRHLYALNTSIEERHRQLKCFSDLQPFCSRALSGVVNQVVFVLLTYSLLPR
jgi:hypothetical protein